MFTVRFQPKSLNLYRCKYVCIVFPGPEADWSTFSWKNGPKNKTLAKQIWIENIFDT